MEEKELLVKLGAQFKERRIEKGLNILQLAELAETTRRTIYIVESGSNYCRPSTYLRIAKALDSDFVCKLVNKDEL